MLVYSGPQSKYIVETIFFISFKGLSNFDKVVGGLVWCIEVCNVDIDIDLLFQEDLSIGKKISLTVSFL